MGEFDDFEEVFEGTRDFFNISFVIGIIFFIVMTIVVIMIIYKALKMNKNRTVMKEYEANHTAELKQNTNKEKIYCEYCGSLMSENDESCKSCGAKRPKKD